MLFLYVVMIFGNCIPAKTVQYSTVQLEEYMNLTAQELQGITVSATHILSIPASLFGTYIITVFGITETTLIFQIIAVLGWSLFADGVTNKCKLEIISGRLINGAVFGAKRVSIISYCTCRFKKNNLSFALGCITMAAKLSMIIGR